MSGKAEPLSEAVPADYETEINALVLRERGKPMQVERIRLRKVGPTDVRVKVTLTGVCHSDFSLARGPLDQPVPAVLGHEASGTVVEVGSQVTRVSVGQRVILLWIAPCGECFYCLRDESYLCVRTTERNEDPYAVDVDGNAVFPGLRVGSFAEQTVVPENAVHAIPDSISDVEAALLGCSITTGVGAVVKAARVTPGSSVLVIGLGGVGMSVVQGARLAGATTIIGVDRNTEKAGPAIAAGATHFLDAADPELRRAVRGLTERRGADFAFDCVGAAKTIRDTWNLTRRGGTACVVGIGGKDDEVSFNALELFHQARTLIGTVGGSVESRTDYQEFFDWVAEGRLDLSSMVTADGDLTSIEPALDRMARGEGLRTLIRP